MLGDVLDGFRSVGSLEPESDGYFGWVASKGYELPKNRTEIYLPEGEDAVPGATDRPARIPKELSDSTFFTEKALTYLKGRDGKPFFLHLGYWRPHPPFVAPAPYHDMYAPADMPPPVRAESPAEEAKQHPLLDFYLRTTRNESFFEAAEGFGAELDEAEILQMRATYYGLMTEVDDCLGRVFDYLDETGQWDDTMIVFTSDHGEQLGDHHLLGKIGYFDESFRVPLVIKDPGKSVSGHIEDSYTESIDIMPTILDWIDGEIPPACDGRSLLPLVHGDRPSDWRTELHYEYDFRDIYYSKPEKELGVTMDEASLCVIQDENYKYVHFAALPALLFDLKADPNQFRNVAEDSEYCGIVRQYAQKMLSWRLIHADRSLTGFRSTMQGLEERKRTTINGNSNRGIRT